MRTAYDAVARAYDAQLRDELDHKPLDRALLTTVAELAGPGTVADVGCEPGHVTRFLAARHGNVVGLDLSPAMIDIARERAPDLQFTVGSLLVAFHVEGPDIGPGEVQHVTHWFGESVDLHGYFVDPVVIRTELGAAGFTVTATLERTAVADVEFPSRRCYMLVRRPGNSDA